MVGAELGVVAKLMPYLMEGIESLTEKELDNLILGPHSRKSSVGKDMQSRIKILSQLWEHISALCIDAERDKYDDAFIAKLEMSAGQLNVFWRDNFGSLRFFFFVLIKPREESLLLKDSSYVTPRTGD